MRGMPFNLQGEGVVELVAATQGFAGAREKGGFWEGVAAGVKRKQGDLLEPRSVLDPRRSPSSPTSTSTLSSSLGGGGASSDTAGVVAVSDSTVPARIWPSSAHHVADLQPIPAALEPGDKAGGLGLEDWEVMLSEPVASPGQEQSFLRWIMGDIEDPSSLVKQQLLSHEPADLDASVGSLGFGLSDPGFVFDPMPGIGSSVPIMTPPLPSGPCTTSPFPSMTSSNITPSAPQNQLVAPMPSIKVPNFGTNPSLPPPVSSLPLSPAMLFQETMEEKPQIFGPSLLQTDSTQNQTFFFPDPPHQLLLPPPKRLHTMDLQTLPKIPFPDPGAPDLFLRRNNPQSQAQPPQLQQPLPYPLQQQRAMRPKLAVGDEQALVDQLFKAAELVEAGNSVGARGILARLNHHLPSSPVGKPLLRSALYFRDALNLLLSSPTAARPASHSTPLDVVLKLSAYKAFSEVSPVLQFTNFTSIQAILEEVGGANRIHIIDFDIGVGGQWSAFMQELAQRRRAASAAAPMLKITAFVPSDSCHHPLELHLTRDNLSHFASELNIPFELNVMSLDSFDPVIVLGMSQDDAIAVNLPVGSALGPLIPSILQLVKQLSPKIVISVDQGCDRSDLPFSHHFVHAFQSSMVLLYSIDAAGTNPDVANKIERSLLQPRIESAVLGRHRTGEKMLPWRTLFASAGLVPLQFSNFTETQAECLLKRVQVRGFHVEKRQASLFLYWQRGELVSISAWRC